MNWCWRLAYLIAPQLHDELAAARDGNVRIVLENQKLLATTGAGQTRAEMASAAETWAHIEHLLMEECGLMEDQGLSTQRSNCINVIANAVSATPNGQLLKAAASFLNAADGLTGISKIRVNGRLMSAGDIARALGADAGRKG